MKTSLCAIAFLFIGMGLVHAGGSSQVDPSGKPLHYTVEAAPAWSDLFNRTHGWFGGDGIFSIPLGGFDENDRPDDETTLLLFSDTFTGDVKAGKPVPGYAMINNSIAYLKGNVPDPANIRFYVKTNADGKPVSLFVPQTSTAARPRLFWLGAGFVNHELDDQLFIFGCTVEHNGPGAFDFITPASRNVAMRLPLGLGLAFASTFLRLNASAAESDCLVGVNFRFEVSID